MSVNWSHVAFVIRQALDDFARADPHALKARADESRVSISDLLAAFITRGVSLVIENPPPPSGNAPADTLTVAAGEIVKAAIAISGIEIPESLSPEQVGAIRQIADAGEALHRAAADALRKQAERN